MSLKEQLLGTGRLFLMKPCVRMATNFRRMVPIRKALLFLVIKARQTRRWTLPAALKQQPRVAGRLSKPLVPARSCWAERPRRPRSNCSRRSRCHCQVARGVGVTRRARDYWRRSGRTGGQIA